MTTITIQQSAIRAVSFAMAKKDIRYYLNGMLLEHNGAETRLVATDGHRLNACLIEHDDALITNPVKIILPASFVDTICKAKGDKRAKTSDIVISFDDTNPIKVSAALPDGTETVGTLVDGRYPDYTRVIPDSFSGETAHYQPSYMLDADLSMLAWFNLGKGKFHGYGFGYNGTNAAGYSVPGFVCVIMPMRADMCKSTDTRFKTEIAKPEAQEAAA